ncbi:MAG: hypothetical protein R3B67_01690 [Phycisphaerales bacterium]
MAHIASVQQNNLDPNTLTHVAHAFQKPLALDGIAKAIDEQIAPIRSIGAEHKDTDFDTILEVALSVIDYEADDSRLRMSSARIWPSHLSMRRDRSCAP